MGSCFSTGICEAEREREVLAAAAAEDFFSADAASEGALSSALGLGFARDLAAGFGLGGGCKIISKSISEHMHAYLLLLLLPMAHSFSTCSLRGPLQVHLRCCPVGAGASGQGRGQVATELGKPSESG